MAEFFADRINVGTEQLPQFQVAITLANYGSSLNGPPKAVAPCATVEELDEQVEALIESLKRATSMARGILEENEGEISSS